MSKHDTPQIQEPPKKDVDNSVPLGIESTQTVEEMPPARVIGDMLNHRRMLKGMLDYTEAYLRQHGKKV